MAKGGYRPGSGRKPGLASVLAEKTRAYIAERINAEVSPLTDALIEKAKKGDVFAFKELFDRAFGKAQQHVDHTTDGQELPQPITTINVQRDYSTEEDKETDEED